jgi:hypothetical protein
MNYRESLQGGQEGGQGGGKSASSSASAASAINFSGLSDGNGGLSSMGLVVVALIGVAALIGLVVVARK